MRRSNEPRIYGPYQHGDQWRLVVRTRQSGGGWATTYRSYPTRAEAEAALAGARSQAQGATVKMAVDALLAVMRKEGLGESTITTAEYRLEHFFQLAKNGNRPLSWLRLRGQELYDAAQVGRSADTHQAELALAKQLGALAVKCRWLRANPFDGIENVGRKRHGSTKPRHTVDEAVKLQRWCLANTGDQCAVLTLAYLWLGSRASELATGSVKAIDGGGTILRIGKAKTTSGVRKLKLPDELRALLLALTKGRRADAPIFTNGDGSRMTRYGAYHHVRRICKAAGVTVLGPQGLRRTQSDLATDAGETSLAVARHLGHASTRVTDRSYRDADVVAAAKQERALRVLAGGLR